MSISGLLLLNLVFNIIHHVVEIGSLIVLYIYLAFFVRNIIKYFNKGHATVSGHISNFFKEGELNEKVVCRNFRQTTKYGVLEGKTQSKGVKNYNLDVIISVGYRVKTIKVHVSVSSSHRIRLLRSPHSTPPATAFVSSGHCIRLLQLMQPSHSANSAVSFC